MLLPGLQCRPPRSGASRPHWEFCSVHVQTTLSEGNIHGNMLRGQPEAGGKWWREVTRFWRLILWNNSFFFPSNSMDWAKIRHLYWCSKALIRLISGIMALESFHRPIKEFLHLCDHALLPFTSWPSGLTSKSHICFSVFSIGMQFHPAFFFETTTAASKNACWGPSCQENCSVTQRDMMMRLQESSLGRCMGLQGTFECLPSTRYPLVSPPILQTIF